MKILMFLHHLVLGGTTVNAVELAAALQRWHGHEVVLFSTPGPLSPVAAAHGVRLIDAPVATHHPSRPRMQALRAAYLREQPNLVHAWEPWACMDAYGALHVPLGVPMLVTDMQMHITPGMPKSLPITFGTPGLVAKARAAGHQRVSLLLPPVDLHINRPGAVDDSAFKQRWHVRPHDITVVTVSRLENTLKGESLQRTIAAIGTLGAALPHLRLLLVGDGRARSALQAQANSVNQALGRDAVVLTGAMQDPRAAYSAASLVIGMGSSALRGMAFAKPTIVVGEQAFCDTFDPQHADHFERDGLYGLGAGASDNSALEQQLLALSQAPATWQALGQASRDWVQARFGLDTVAQALHEQYVDAVLAQQLAPGADLWDAVKTSAAYLRHRRFLWRSSEPPAMVCTDLAPTHERPAA
jgi:L-malate glycosyltransferase